MAVARPGLDLRDFGEAVREALIQAALDAHEDAGIRGLCAEGRWEAAVGAIRSLDLSCLADSVGADDQ